MKIRTAEQLYNVLAADLVWRKKEISSLKLLTEGSRTSPDRQAALLRASVALLYAHWEGFIKAASNHYVELVAFQRLKYQELSASFVALGVRALLRRASQSSAIAAHVEVTEFLLNRLGEQSNLPYKDAVSTEANLSSRVLKEITDTLGLDYLPFATKANLIDESLLARRNHIAHGEYLTITLDSYRDLSDEVVGMMDMFFANVANAAVLREYRRAA